MAKTLKKGYQNTGATTESVLGSAYSLEFANYYTPTNEGGKNGDNEAKDLYINASPVTTNASEYVHFDLDTDKQPVTFKGYACQAAAKKRPGVNKKHQVRTIAIGLEGWDIVDDPDNSDFEAYSLAYYSGLNLSFEKDDLVTPAVVEERLERLISLLTYDAGTKSRIARLIYGKYQELN